MFKLITLSQIRANRYQNLTIEILLLSPLPPWSTVPWHILINTLAQRLSVSDFQFLTCLQNHNKQIYYLIRNLKTEKG